MEHLLQKFRQISSVFQQSGALAAIASSHVREQMPFTDLAVTLGKLLDANVYIVSRDCDVIGYAESYTMASERFSKYLKDAHFPQEYMERLTIYYNTADNLTVNDLDTIFPTENKEVFHDGLTTIVPIFISGNKLGSLILGRIGRRFDDQDLILAEYSATMVGIELLHLLEREARERDRENAQITMAISSLSYSEREAIRAIFSALENREGRVTASKIAEDHKLTRSVIVNALRKLESAGLIESQSLGMRGTYIRVLSENIFTKMQHLN